MNKTFEMLKAKKSIAIILVLVVAAVFIGLLRQKDETKLADTDTQIKSAKPVKVSPEIKADNITVNPNLSRTIEAVKDQAPKEYILKNEVTSKDVTINVETSYDKGPLANALRSAEVITGGVTGSIDEISGSTKTSADPDQEMDLSLLKVNK